MISNLTIAGLGIIETADLDLRPGMVAFTGETGAGKTMLTSALGLVFGDRADHSLVGSQNLQVSARVVVPADSVAAGIVTGAGGQLDTGPAPDPDPAADPTDDPADDPAAGPMGERAGDAEILLARTLTTAGRSRAHAGGHPVPVATLTAVAAEVVSRHGQNDQITLRRPARQRSALDRFAGPGLTDELAGYRVEYAEYLRLSRELAQWREQQRELTRESVILEQGVAEITELDPAPGEQAELTTEISRLGHIEELQQAARQAHRAVSGDELAEQDPGITGQLASAIAELRRVVARDPELNRPLQLLTDAQNLVSEAGGELSGYLAGLDADPGQLDKLQSRLSQLNGLCRKYGEDLEAVLRWADVARERLGGMDPTGAVYEAKRAELVALAARLADRAERISEIRTRSAKELAEQVTGELQELSMPQARMLIDVTQRPDPGGLLLSDGRQVAFGENGIDLIAFQLQPHAGANPSPLGEGASGGEMSRIMLAIEVVLAQSQPPRVFLFDEVDAGVGGRAAIEVGRRLARLATRSQVLVVTHLPQVAAFAEQQLLVAKDSNGQVTRTSVTEVSGEVRLRELSRMLSGLPGSQSGLSHASELLDLAEQERQGFGADPV